MEYEFSPVNTDSNSLKEIATLLRVAFPKSTQFNEKFLEWEYRDNPDGKIVGYNAYYNGLLVAHYVLQPMSANINGKTEKGLLSLNTATHPLHQGKKLFTRLAEKSYDLAKSKAYTFVVGVANANSTHGFINKLGFQLVGKLHAKIGMGNISRIKNIQTEYERIWNDTNLKWRISNPENVYKIKNNFIMASAHMMGIEAILIEFEKANTLLQSQKSFNPQPLKLWIGIDHSVDWKKSFYFDIPNKLRPSPLNFIFKDLTNAKRKLNYESVKFSAIDFDAY